MYLLLLLQLLLLFFNHHTHSKIPLCQTAEQKTIRRIETKEYKKTVRQYTFAWEAVEPVAWYHVFTSSLIQQKPVALPKEAVLPCLFVLLIIPASASCVPPPSSSYSSQAEVLMQKKRNQANYSYFYPSQLPDSSQLFLLAHVRARKINMCGKEVHFLVVVVSIAGSSCYWNGWHIKCCNIFL